MAPLTLILNYIFKLIFKKIFHSQNPHWAFYCGKLGPVNHPPQKTINFIQLKHSMDWAWHFDEIAPLLLIIYELPPTFPPLTPSSSCPPSKSGGGTVTLNCSLGFIEYNIWVSLYEPAILQLIQNYKRKKKFHFLLAGRKKGHGLVMVEVALADTLGTNSISRSKQQVLELQAFQPFL